jgi:hypothetical protein
LKLHLPIKTEKKLKETNWGLFECMVMVLANDILFLTHLMFLLTYWFYTVSRLMMSYFVVFLYIFEKKASEKWWTNLIRIENWRKETPWLITIFVCPRYCFCSFVTKLLVRFLKYNFSKMLAKINVIFSLLCSLG